MVPRFLADAMNCILEPVIGAAKEAGDGAGIAR
jgi:hypothetical protein